MRIVTLWMVMLLTNALASGQAAPAPSVDSALPFSLKALGHGVYAAIDNSKGEAGANAGFVVGDDGIAVIDTFENEAAARALLGEIRSVSKLPIKFVVNTHYHLDHVAGRENVGVGGAEVLVDLDQVEEPTVALHGPADPADEPVEPRPQPVDLRQHVDLARLDQSPAHVVHRPLRTLQAIGEPSSL